MRKYKYARVARLLAGLTLLMLCYASACLRQPSQKAVYNIYMIMTRRRIISKPPTDDGFQVPGIFQFVTYATNKTAVRIIQLWDREKALNATSFVEEPLRHIRNYDVILSAYMNSGSTFTGRILGFREDAFYFYEPLWRLTLWDYYKSNFTLCSTRTRRCRVLLKEDMNKNKPIAGRSRRGLDFNLLHDEDIINKSITPLEIAQRILHHVFHSRLLQVQNLIQPGVTENAAFSGPSWNNHRYCMQRRKSFEHCLETLQLSSCKVAKHRVSKVIRLSLGALETLLREIPSLKVIHLFRDPRAIIHSRLETHGYPLGGITASNSITNNAKALCDKMSSDLEDGKRLKKRFPNRFRFIHYEDIYTRDYSLIELHTFLGMTVNKGNLEFARLPLSNHGGLRSHSAWSERRENNAFWWRKHLRWNTVKLIDAECSFLYTELGYPHILDKNDMAIYNETMQIQKLTFSFK